MTKLVMQLKEYIESNPKSHAEIAEEMNVSQTALSRWVRGDIDPSPYSRGVIADFLAKVGGVEKKTEAVILSDVKGVPIDKAVRFMQAVAEFNPAAMIDFKITE